MRAAERRKRDAIDRIVDEMDKEGITFDDIFDWLKELDLHARRYNELMISVSRERIWDEMEKRVRAWAGENGRDFDDEYIRYLTNSGCWATERVLSEDALLDIILEVTLNDTLRKYGLKERDE